MLTFGKYKGKPLHEIPPSYLRWVLTSDSIKGKDEVIAAINAFLEGFLDEDFTFGKYKGLRLSEVMLKDPEYIEWLKTKLDPAFKGCEAIMKALSR